MQYEVFRRGSRTYYNSSRFFPQRFRDRVAVLYAFVRRADDYVDAVPQNPEGFRDFCYRYRSAITGAPVDDEIVSGFVELSKECDFERDWAEAFLHSMELDLTKNRYEDLSETLEYVYGSAEVIGFFMARMMELPAQAYAPASKLGRAMQFINFIRDIDEDNQLGRTYLPMSETTLANLKRESAEADPREFGRFLQSQLTRYREWQAEAERGYPFIPRRMRIAIKTAGDMYNWTGRQIAQNPFVVFQRKVKPKKSRIVIQALGNLVAA
jgi:phytoene synthase